jgi:NADPH-dependent ferric siderophore reductase
VSDISSPARRVQRVRHELVRRDVVVRRIEALGPGFASITFGGESLAGFTSLSFDDHVKFMFAGADGEWVRRDYTPRRFDAAARELTLEFALHGDGAACRWAQQAQVGQTATIGGPRGSMIIDPAHDWHLLVGDETALPAISRRLEELPGGTQALVLAQVNAAADRRPLASAAALQVQWAATPEELLAALRALQLPAGEGFAWGGGEASLMTRARALLAERLPREALRFSAYWKQGASDFHENLDA